MESPRGHGGSHGEDDGLSLSPEAARRLRVMALREGEEPDLPDELLRSNKTRYYYLLESMLRPRPRY
jgi:hypothetical protein